MRSSSHIFAILVGATLLVAAGPVDRGEVLGEDVEAAMIQEGYASFVDAAIAKQARDEGYDDLAVLLDRMSARNRTRFEQHRRLLPAESLEDGLSQVVGAAIAQEFQYAETTLHSRAEDDAEMATHFEALTGEAHRDRELLQRELERAFASRPAI